MKNKSAVLFDLDGTLLDTAPDLVSSFNELLRRHQRPEISMEAMRPLLTHGSNYFIKNFFKADASAEEMAMLRSEYLKLYSETAHQNTCLFPGIFEVLQSINSKNIPWGIVTNKLTMHAMENLARLDLPFKPGAVVCGDTLPKHKPDPEPLWHACDLLQVTANQVIFVGDSEVDAEAGLRAGIDTLIVEHGYHLGEDTFNALKIAGFIRDPRDVLRWIIK